MKNKTLKALAGLLFTALFMPLFATTSSEGIFSGKGIIGDMYYLNQSYLSMAQSADSNFGEGSNSGFYEAEKNIASSFNTIISEVAKNKFGSLASVSVSGIDRQSSRGNFYDFPSQSNISIEGVSSSVANQIYQEASKAYVAAQDSYLQFSALSKEIYSGDILKNGVDGLAKIESAVADISKNLESFGLAAVGSNILGDSPVESIGDITSFGYDFTPSTQDYSKMGTSINPSGGGSDTSGMGGISCCSSSINSIVSKLKDEVKEIVPKEASRVHKLSGIVSQMSADTAEKIGGNVRSGTTGAMNTSNAGLLYLDGEETIFLLKKLKNLAILKRTSELAFSKSQITELEIKVSNE